MEKRRWEIGMEIQMRLMTCANCGIAFAMPESVAERRERDHSKFYCPAGHNNYYPQKSDVDALREKLIEKEKALALVQMELLETRRS